MSRIEDTRRTGNDEGSSFSSRIVESPFRTNSTREGPISRLDGASPLDDDGAARPIYPASLANDGDTHGSSSPTSPDDDYFSNCSLSSWAALQWDDDPPLTTQGGVQSTENNTGTAATSLGEGARQPSAFVAGGSLAAMRTLLRDGRQLLGPQRNVATDEATIAAVLSGIANRARSACDDLKADGGNVCGGEPLTQDEACAIAGYTSDVRPLGLPRSASFYYQLNEWLREAEHQVEAIGSGIQAPTTALGVFAYHLFLGLRKLRPQNLHTVVANATPETLGATGSILVQRAITSVSRSRRAAEAFAAARTSAAPCVLLEIRDVKGALNLAPFSMYPREAEYVLLPGAVLTVGKITVIERNAALYHVRCQQQQHDAGDIHGSPDVGSQAAHGSDGELIGTQPMHVRRQAAEQAALLALRRRQRDGGCLSESSSTTWSDAKAVVVLILTGPSGSGKTCVSELAVAR